ncbi:GNAT family N-acetyltransferase [Actinophytocola oryzae]|uniref:Ribosomal protein S18 acetylase RimI-like enzyme n=1 Tax=Actinophytocola oryzae TaxID=502181 RepID=A0A4R7VRU4_9PSEU|nr:GNAT family N-acetyltransferase [Actinophytocola oryzae]TDV52474.1 ribosomal protein S18 acetylase RimI-like enzyme [Actinophytocola oryzae]
MSEIRRIRPSDVDVVVKLVHALAAHERAPQECHLTAESLHDALFRSSPALFGHVATVDDEVVGYALWFLNYSTWRGTHGIYLEDLFVLPEHRGTGLGKGLLTELAAECVRRGYSRLEWMVLEWLKPSIEFYESIGAVPQDEWRLFRLTDEPLRRLGS